MINEARNESVSLTYVLVSDGTNYIDNKESYYNFKSKKIKSSIKLWRQAILFVREPINHQQQQEKKQL